MTGPDDLEALAATADAARMRWAELNGSPLPVEPVVVPPTLPTVRRPHWCALCGAEAPYGETYCPPCRPKALEDRKRALLADALESIPEAFAWCRLASPALADVVPPAHLDAARSGLDRSMVLLVGPKGAGKTSLAIAMLRARLDAALAPDADGDAVTRAAGARFASAFDLAYARADAQLGAEPAALRAWKRATVLVVDDLGAEAKAHNSPVGELIHHRHAHALPTIVTTGFNSKELTERYGDGIVRRLTDRALILTFKLIAPGAS